MSWLRKISAGSEWLVLRLALLFGFVWTVWAFFIVPLVAPYISETFSAKVFYYGSGWVQLFALPLLTWIANKAAAQQTELLEEVRSVVNENQRLAKIIENLTQALARHGIEPPDPS